jgi:hypothetical protein
MEVLKMKFKLHGLEFEIEGSESIVTREFENFKNFTLDIMSKGNIVIPQAQTIETGKLPPQIVTFKDAIPIEKGDYPVMKEIVKKDLPKTESDWILIYAFYASKFGDNTFTEKSIQDYYESTGRKNVSRYKNLSNNIKTLLNKEYIKVHNDTEYLIKDAGVKYAQQIIQGNSTGKSTKKSNSSKANRGDTISENKDNKAKLKSGKKSNSVGFIDLKLTPAEQKSLNDFYSSKSPKTQNEKVIVAMKWFIDDKRVDEVSMEEMNYLLSITSEALPALPQVLGNMVGAGFRWVTKGEVGKYKLSSIGENYVVNKLPKAGK